MTISLCKERQENEKVTFNCMCIQINETSSLCSSCFYSDTQLELHTPSGTVDHWSGKNFEAWNFAKENSYCRESVLLLLFSHIATLHLLTQILRINPCTWLLKWMYYFYLHWWEKWWLQANCDHNVPSILVGSPYHAGLQVWVVEVLSKEWHTKQLMSTREESKVAHDLIPVYLLTQTSSECLVQSGWLKITFLCIVCVYIYVLCVYIHTHYSNFYIWESEEVQRHSPKNSAYSCS